MVAIRKIESIDMGIPVIRKSRTDRYGRCRSSVISKLLTLGNDEKGKAMAADTRKIYNIIY